MSARYEFVAIRARHRCEYCHAPEAVFNFPFEVEHVIPRSRGGIDHEDNLALACRSCNLFMAAHILGVDPQTSETVSIFQPRLNDWDEHFRIDVESGEVIGLTAEGRATVARLEMNSDAQRAARKQWMRLGLFP